MPIPAWRTRFGGYAAVPFRSVYLQPGYPEDLAIARQLKAVGDREGFDVWVQATKALHDPEKVPRQAELIWDPWSQDHKFFQWTRRGEVLRMLAPAYPGNTPVVRALGKLLKLPVARVHSHLEGGNFFIGKQADGLYAIVGSDAVDKTARALCHREFHTDWERDDWESPEEATLLDQVDTYYDTHPERYRGEALRLIAKDLRLKPERITVVSQPDFHIDLGLRPLHDNIVLLNDPALSQALLDEARRTSDDPTVHRQLRFLKDSLERYRKYQQRRGYADTDTLERQLKTAGFRVIRIPGVVRMRTSERYPAPDREAGRCVSYANALVHQRKNGELVYITNASYLPLLDRLFERELKARAPWIKQVDWISGQTKPFRDTPFHTNAIATHLDLGGGIHCLSNERPDFKAWLASPPQRG